MAKLASVNISLRFPQPKKIWPPRYYYNIVESGVKCTYPIIPFLEMERSRTLVPCYKTTTSVMIKWSHKRGGFSSGEGPICNILLSQFIWYLACQEWQSLVGVTLCKRHYCSYWKRKGLMVWRNAIIVML